MGTVFHFFTTFVLFNFETTIKWTILDSILRNTMKYYLILIFFTALIACGEDTPEYRVEIDPELQVHFDNFVREAAKRGLLVDYERLGSSLLGSLEDVPERAAGLCNNSGDTREVIIDRAFWRSEATTEIRREWVVFHELGHCILGLEHRNEVDEMGNCLSMMNGEDYRCAMLYDADTKDYFLDKLFSE